MPLTTIPLAINIIIGGAIWISELPTTMKVIITVLLVVKFFTYFYSVLMAVSDLVRNVGLIVCGLLNLGGIIYTAIQGIWTATILFATLLVILIVWRVLPSIDFSRKGGKEK